jgi:hypothetical protein
MRVIVHNKNGIRYGSFEIHGIKGRFPVQAITSTNLNHATLLNSPNLDFKTSFLEIIEKYPKRVITDHDYRKDRIEKISKIIEQNPNKLCFLILRGIRNTVRMTKERNLSMIDFQVECGFKLIKVFFSSTRKALENSREYRSLIPADKTLVMVLDESLPNLTFKTLYIEALRHRDKIIGFFGREPKETNEDNKLNFQFIGSRERDRIIRFTSFTRKRFGKFTSSLVYHLFGFDAYSFLTRFGPPNKPLPELFALNGFTFEQLTSNTSLVCVVTGSNLHTSSKRFESEKKSSVPVSVHDIVNLNEEFEFIQNRYTREELELLVKDYLF